MLNSIQIKIIFLDKYKIEDTSKPLTNTEKMERLKQKDEIYTQQQLKLSQK